MLGLLAACADNQANPVTAQHCDPADPFCTVTMIPAANSSTIDINGEDVPISQMDENPSLVIDGVCPNPWEYEFTLPDGSAGTYLSSDIFFQRAFPTQALFGESAPVVLCDDRLQRIDAETGKVETVSEDDEDSLYAEMTSQLGETIGPAGQFGSTPASDGDSVLFPYASDTHVGVGYVSWDASSSGGLDDVLITSGAEYVDVVPELGGIHFLPTHPFEIQDDDHGTYDYPTPREYTYYDQASQQFSPVIALPQYPPDLAGYVTDDGTSYADLTDTFAVRFGAPMEVDGTTWISMQGYLTGDYEGATKTQLLRYDLSTGELVSAQDLGVHLKWTDLISSPFRVLSGTDYVVAIAEDDSENHSVLFFARDGQIIDGQGIEGQASWSSYDYFSLSEDGRRLFVNGTHDTYADEDGIYHTADEDLPEVETPQFNYTWLEEESGEIHTYDGIEAHTANLDYFTDGDRVGDIGQFTEDPNSQRYTVHGGHHREYVISDTQDMTAYSLSLPIDEGCYRVANLDPFNPDNILYYSTTCHDEMGFKGWPHPITVAGDKLLVGHGTQVYVYGMP